MHSFDPTKPIVVLPARLKSTRLPRKMTLEVAPGLPLIVASALNAKKAVDQVIVATDSVEIAQVLEPHHIPVIMTPEQCPSGTDRLAFFVESMGWGRSIFDDNPWVINVQGDEPLLEPALITQLIEACNQNPHADIITAAVKLHSAEEWHNPNCVKVVTPAPDINSTQSVLYFSRSPVPYHRDQPGVPPLNAWRHLGVYAYQARTLAKWATLAPSLMEDTEKLEQWRAIENGMRFKTITLDRSASISVDSLADLQLVQAVFRAQTAA